jgi:flavin reductase (DIM6/NTAB) family NADH-FMN oxidoreductase RutF
MTTLTTAPDIHFDPQADDAAFRAAIGSFASGVTIVTTDRGEGPMGIVASGFTAVSFDPALVMWCPSKTSHRFEHFGDARRFAIHVLNDGQKPIVDAIEGSKTAFGGFDWSPSHAGIPLIHGVSACFECNLEAAHDAGDHAIIVGRVTRAHHQGGVPLVKHDGRYGGFAERISGS